MKWYYVDKGQQAGPVSDAQLDEFLIAGRITRDTLVWYDGMGGWQPLGIVRSDNPSAAPRAISNICAECGRTFPAENLVQLNRVWICAECKPKFLQKMQEGVATPAVVMGNMWRANNRLVTVSETLFPDRCVKCNAPANGYRLKRVLYWQHPAYYLLLLVNLLVLIIVVLAVRKKAVLHVGLCEKHRAVRKQTIWIGWIGAFGGLALAIGALAFAFYFNFGLGVVFGITGFFVAVGFLLYAGLKAPMVSAAKITKENVWLKGVHHDFLEGLPLWPGS